MRWSSSTRWYVILELLAASHWHSNSDSHSVHSFCSHRSSSLSPQGIDLLKLSPTTDISKLPQGYQTVPRQAAQTSRAPSLIPTEEEGLKSEENGFLLTRMHSMGLHTYRQTICTLNRARNVNPISFQFSKLCQQGLVTVAGYQCLATLFIQCQVSSWKHSGFNMAAGALSLHISGVGSYILLRHRHYSSVAQSTDKCNRFLDGGQQHRRFLLSCI